MAYMCKNCGFKIERAAQKCPYCDKKSLEQEKSAEELLSEVSEE